MTPPTLWEHRYLAGIRKYRPTGGQGGTPGSVPQRCLPPGRRRSRPGAFATPSRRERVCSRWCAQHTAIGDVYI